jgi:hypothetical protein
MRPAGQGLKYDPLEYGKVGVFGRFSSSPGIELPGPVVPSASQLGSFNEGSSAVDPRPLERASDKSFLAGLGEEIAKTSHLSRFFVADLNGSVSPSPELLPPAGESAGFFGEIGLEVLHETGELVRSLDAYEEMEVVGEKGPGEEYDAIAALSPTEDADQDLIDAGARSQEESPVQSAAGQLEDRAAGRDIEQRSSHLV